MYTLQVLMGLPYGSIPRKTVPREDQDRAMDYAVLTDFNVSSINCSTWIHVLFIFLFYLKNAPSCSVLLNNNSRSILTGLLQVLCVILWLL